MPMCVLELVSYFWSYSVPCLRHPRWIGGPRRYALPRLARSDNTHADEQRTDAERGDDTDGTPAWIHAETKP